MFAVERIRLVIRALKARFRDQRVELDFIKRCIRPGDVVCDIGANKGSFTYWLSRWGGSVVAFEPQPDLARRLAAMSLSNVTVEAKAVYSHSGTLDLFVPAQHQPGASLIRGDNCLAIPVPVVSLDDYFKETTVRLLKIDVEGAELHALKGAEKLLKRSLPFVIFECETRHLIEGSVNDTFSYLERLGYEGQFVCRGELLPVAQFDPSVHQPQNGEWFWKREDYCNNFIFSPG